MFQKGLKDVVAVHTKVASVDGDIGELRYRGVKVEDLIPKLSFEQLADFIWGGERKEAPSNLQVNENQSLPEYVKQILDALPKDISLMDAMRTAVSAFAYAEFHEQTIEDQAIALTAALPVIAARHYRNQNGLEPVDPNPSLSFTANYLWMLFGVIPQDVHVEALETYLKLTMEHGLNASTFAARVTISTESDLTAAITSALGTMKGPLHGGAPSGVIDLLEEVQKSGDIHATVEEKLINNERIMGFGHRVYKTEDPRSVLLREKCVSMMGEDRWLDLAIETERIIVELLEKHKPGRKLYTNVEYYAAAIMRSIDMPPELFTPTFSIARMVGWTAHAVEQLSDITIFRPQSIYVGELLETK